MNLSPLRYPGGKAKLAPWFIKLMRENHISGGRYIEPYAGGSGVALHLLITGIVNHIHINDYDTGIYLFWKHVVEHPNDLVKLIQDTPVTIEEWHTQREVLKNPIDHSETEIAFSTFFLNRTNRSGIIKGGVIGGAGQTGKYKINARYNKNELCQRILRIASFRKFINITCLDSLCLLDELANHHDKRSLIYLDPPYYQKGQGLYLNAYTDEDHAAIAKKIKELNRPWVLTYDNHPRIKELYQWTNEHQKDVRYSANQRRLEKELIFCGNLNFVDTRSTQELQFTFQ